MYVQTTKKRVWCLYRVSTLGQVDHDDIPMQRAQCQQYAASRPDWVIEKELYEKGVSGFKVRAKDREKLMILQEAARTKEFDILLVFMFDRIGRRTDETPFILKWFIDKGIEVWSVKEGQRRIETHEDELLTYMSTWMASGESKKTAIRVSASKDVLSHKGHYSGGYVGYGFDAVDLGRVNKKGHTVRDLVVNEVEAEIIKFIFHSILNLGWGTHTVAMELNRREIKTKNGGYWRGTSVRSIIANPKCTGRFRTKDGVSVQFQELVIIDDDTFQSAQDMVKSRAVKLSAGRNGPLKTDPNKVNKGLLSGLLHCGSCKGKLFFNHMRGQKLLPNGEYAYYPNNYYRCSRRIDNPTVCNSKPTYKVEAVDAYVTIVVREFLMNIKQQPTDDMLQKAMSSGSSLLSVSIKEAEKKLAKEKRAMETLDGEAVKALMGESIYTTDVISRLHPIQVEKLKQAEVEYKRLSTEYKSELERKSQYVTEMQRYQGWADIFDDCEFDQKRMIVASIVESVTIYPDMKVSIKLRLSVQQFLGNDSEESKVI